jgi:hypothetical protein
MSPRFTIILLASAVHSLHALQQVYPMTTRGSIGSRTTRGAVAHTPLLNLAMDTVFPDENKPVYLQLDSGIRVSKIITATTTSFDAMLKIGRATSRMDIMKTCLIRHKRTCVLSEHQTLPAGRDGAQHRRGWSYEHRTGSSVRTTSGSPASVLWVVDMDPQSFQVSVGSWLLASVATGTDNNRLSGLFTRTISRALPEPQAISLVRPGFLPPTLVHTASGLQWIVVFIELQDCTELGGAK